MSDRPLDPPPLLQRLENIEHFLESSQREFLPPVEIEWLCESLRAALAVQAPVPPHAAGEEPSNRNLDLQASCKEFLRGCTHTMQTDRPQDCAECTDAFVAHLRTLFDTPTREWRQRPRKEVIDPELVAQLIAEHQAAPEMPDWVKDHADWARRVVSHVSSETLIPAIVWLADRMQELERENAIWKRYADAADAQKALLIRKLATMQPVVDDAVLKSFKADHAR